jgi:hypothetical protein
MKYICAQPATQYFAWQIDVMLHSFVTTGVNLEDVHIVCAIHGEIDEYFTRLMEKYPGVIFSFYEDTRHDNGYISSIRPHILRKHFTAYPDLSNEVIMYHDCDIVFTKRMYLPENVYVDDICYLSDTISYIGYEYIESKGKEVLDKMCQIVGIDEKTIKDNQENSGGAQYILKGIDKYFWYDVENDSTRLFKEVTELNTELVAKNEEDYNPLQIWCADMWAVLWNVWKRNKKTKVIPELDFSWSVSSKDLWHKHAIYHNAGVTEKSPELFFKGKYIQSMPEMDLQVNNTKCSHHYYKLIQQALS